MARIVIVSGPCGSGKSTLSGLLAENSVYPAAAHIHTDDFYGYIRKGFIPPWEPESNAQNATMIRAVAACAEEYCRGGYEVFIDGVVGPWFLEDWRGLAAKGLDVRYVILKPNLQETIRRADARESAPRLSRETVEHMWNDFDRLGEYETHTVDTTCQSASESAEVIRRMLDAGDFRLKLG